MKDPQLGPSMEDSQGRAIEESEEMPVEKEYKRRSPLYSNNAYKVQKPSGADVFFAELDTVSVLLQNFQMCFKGSFSNNW